MKIRYLGHSSFLIQIAEHTLCIDPFISANPKAKNIDVTSIRTDYILLTHGHQDHVLDAEQIARASEAKIISNYEIASWYEAKGISSIGMNTGGLLQLGFCSIKVVTAVHSSVLPDGSYAGNPIGFVISTDDRTVYVAGDTALTMDMKLIPVLCPNIDCAILPVGDHFTMGYKDALICAQWVHTKRVIACHFDTFDVIRLDHDAALKYFEKHDLYLDIPQINESFDI